MVVIPKDFAPDGKIRIVSCKSLEKKYSIGVLNKNLTSHKRVPITDNKNEYATLTGFSGYLPTDYLSGETSFVDEKVKYKNSTSMIPSPYFNNNPNPEYYKTIPENNCFGDFNGLINTKGLIESISGYNAANAAYEFSDGVSNQQWYLPSMGELGYLIVRLKMINNTLILLNGDVIPANYTGSDILWSSTNYNTQNYCSVDVYNGEMHSTYTSGDGIIRPFSLVDVVNTSD